MSKVETIQYGSVKAYAKVAERLKDFREKNPRASVKTTVLPQDDGMIIQAYILADKAEDTSADATGTAYYSAKQLQQQKSFEKLETIAVGRALALLGWLNDGEIATTEEMEEFESYKTERKAEEKQQVLESIESAKSIEYLKQLFVSLGDLMLDEDIVAAKDKAKEKFNASN